MNVPLGVSRLGVQRTLMMSTIPAILGCILQFTTRIATESGLTMFVSVLCVGRFLVGIHAGSSLCLFPVFIAEISPVKYRSFLSTFQVHILAIDYYSMRKDDVLTPQYLLIYLVFTRHCDQQLFIANNKQVFQALCTLIGFVTGSEHLINMGEYRFEWMQMVAVLPSVAFFIMLIFLPKSPRDCLVRIKDSDKENQDLMYRRCLMSAKKTETSSFLANKSIKFYYGHDDADNINDALLAENAESTCCDESWNWVTVKGLILGCVAAMSFAFTGDDIIDQFSAHIIHNVDKTKKSIGSDLRSDLLTIFLGAILFVTSTFGSFLIDKYGRRRLMLAGLVGTSISNGIVLINKIIPSPSLTVTAFAITKCFIGLGAGAPAWFLTSELVPPRMMSICQAISTGLLLIVTGIITLFYLELELSLSVISFVILASGPAMCSAFILFLFLPETRNKNYTQVSSELSGHFFSGLSESKPPQTATSHYGSLEDNDQLQSLI
ncbi:unnamed protein product [Anisakis simplex]|uniref:MFS domain-containing protein n=1 Tax=Anisakis simplex TaxID=6269 RepID=A0A0M3JXU0_ANISI|nr:unnamed protein product [Anisakis simplex]